MDVHEVRILLEKYFAGETSLKDEQGLKTWFREPQTDPWLKAMQPLFLYFMEEQQIIPDEGFGDRILAGVIDKSNAEKKGILLTWNTWLSAAATAVILLGAGWFYLRPGTSLYSKSATSIVVYAGSRDTFQSPGQAMAEVQRAILAMSDNLERGNQITLKNMSGLQALGKVMQ